MPDRQDHTVIESQEPTASNGYTWYRKYADGWVEQGGKFQKMNTTSLQIDLPVEMVDTNYSRIGTGNAYGNTSGHFAPGNCFTTYFKAGVGADNGGGGWWEVKGDTASTPAQNVICIKY